MLDDPSVHRCDPGPLTRRSCSSSVAPLAPDDLLVRAMLGASQECGQPIDPVPCPLLTDAEHAAELGEEDARLDAGQKEVQLTFPVLPPKPVVEQQGILGVLMPHPQRNSLPAVQHEVVEHLTRIGVRRVREQIALAIVDLHTAGGDPKDRLGHLLPGHSGARRHARQYFTDG